MSGSSKPAARARAQQRIIAPVAGALRRAGRLSALSGAIWPLQAAAVAWAVAQWTAGAAPMRAALIAAAAFIIGGAARAWLDHRAAALVFDAADETIAREREALIGREARARAPDGSAAVAALLVQKLPLLHPWITRYDVAMRRVTVLPLLMLALTFGISWAAGLVLLVAGPLIPLFMALVGMAAEDAARRQMDEIGDLNAMTMERLSAMLDIRLLGASDRVAVDFAARAERLRARTMAVLRIAFLSSTVLELFAAIGVAMIAVFVGFTLLGAIDFGVWRSPLSPGEGVFLLLIAPEFFQPLRDLAAAWHDRAAGLAVVAELDRLDDAQRIGFVGEGAPAAPLSGGFSLISEGAVVMRPGARVAIPDFTLGPGESLALTGPSGAGKSTALAAIAGLIPLSAGRMVVCGRTLDAGTADGWRARLAVIAQRPHFPDAPLGDWLDPRGTGARPDAALAMADAAGVVGRLPQGLATHLGESGGGVSGGEARRLMIARAVMMGGDAVLADEPTADLDPETAQRVIAALLRLRAQGRALIVATHDPALANAMDRRLEMGA